jgi:hypothetical protein
MEQRGQLLGLGFADSALAVEDFGDAALGKNGPWVARLQVLLREGDLDRFA